MSMRFVDLQTLLARTADASRAQEGPQRAQQAAQQASLHQLQQAAEAAPRRVAQVAGPDGRRVQSATEQGRRYGRRQDRRRPQPPALRRPAGSPDAAEVPSAARRRAVPGLGDHVDVRA